MRPLAPILAAALVAPASAQSFVQPPARWFSGDTHEHIQLCSGPVIAPIQVLGQQVIQDLDLAAVSIWGRGIDSQGAFDFLMQDVTGFEHPLTTGLEQIMQFCVEVSEFEADRFGHIIGLGIGPAQTAFYDLGLGCLGAPDGSGNYAAPLLDLFRTAPNAVTGYVHVVWPMPMYDPGGGFDWEDPSLPAYVGRDARCSFELDFAFPPMTEDPLIPQMAPIDIVTGRIDYIEAPSLEMPALGYDYESRWLGMYYKLMNAGARVSIAAGSDADCIPTLPRPRTWVRLQDGEPFTFDSWTRGLADGRVSLSGDPAQMLEIEVGGQSAGSEVRVSSQFGLPVVPVTARLHFAGSSPSAAVEVLLDGQVLTTVAVPPGTGSPFEVTFDVPVAKSGWFCARSSDLLSHTGAVYTIVDGRPIANCAEAEYWTIFCDYFRYQIDRAAITGTLASIVGCSETEIRDHIEKGRRVFAALRDYALPPPSGVLRIGEATGTSCSPPAGIVTTDTAEGGVPLVMRCFHAPADSPGVLVLGSQLLPFGVPVLGAELYVGFAQGSYILMPLGSDESGYTEIEIPFPGSFSGTAVVAQYIWANPVGCTDDGVLSSSQGLYLAVQ